MNQYDEYDDEPMMSDLQYKEYCRAMKLIKSKNEYIKYLQKLLRDAGIEYFEISMD